MSLLEGHLNTDPTRPLIPDLAIVDSALMPQNPDSGDAYVEAGSMGNGQISVYVVRQGDTLSSIAKMYGVSTNTIVWANDIKANQISPGQQLVILPISGVKHTVVRGDTLQTIAKKYKADLGDILSYNGLASDSALSPGDIIIVPDGEMGASVSGSSGTYSIPTAGGLYGSARSIERLLVNTSKLPSYPGYFAKPLSFALKSQGLHGYNAVDLAAPQGTPILAAANGIVIISKTGGYNGGYGTYVVVSHPNGTQTLYAHMSVNAVRVGDSIKQGQAIGAVGSTGKSTGPHLHIEVRGAKNPF